MTWASILRTTTMRMLAVVTLAAAAAAVCGCQRFGDVTAYQGPRLDAPALARGAKSELHRVMRRMRN